MDHEADGEPSPDTACPQQAHKEGPTLSACESSLLLLTTQVIKTTTTYRDTENKRWGGGNGDVGALEEKMYQGENMWYQQRKAELLWERD